MLTREQALNILLKNPYKFGHLLGFTKLTPLHNEWIRKMISHPEDITLQAHRGSYKTTCVSIALSIIVIVKPTKKTMFMRKTDGDIREVITQVQKILCDPHTQLFCVAIYGCQVKLLSKSSGVVNTNLSLDVKGTPQLVGIGTSSSLTGKHFDYIFTDDIVNVNDRISKAERDRIKLVYQELQNIKNRGGRIFNTGTPWHKDDCFTIMPNPKVYDCYSTGLMTDAEIEHVKAHMTSSLFAANYEMRHVSEDDVLFDKPNLNADASLAEQGLCHIDAAYGGEDSTAFTICARKNGKYYIFGKLYHKHIDDVQDEIISYVHQFNGGKIYCENNADKGYLAKQLRQRGESVCLYHEDMNKFFKITSYLKTVWPDVYFVTGTDQAYIDEVCDFNENAAHDDAPDSLASLIRVFSKRPQNEEYKSLWMLGEN